MTGRKPLVATHSGKFHADDAFAVAALELLLGEIELKRTRDAADISTADYVVDVGGVYDPQKNRFDHHQSGGAGKRENGIPYSAFGLVWKTYGEKICGSADVAVAVDAKLVQPIDADDSGVVIAEPLFPPLRQFALPDMISSFLPTWKEKDASLDEVFKDAADVAKGILHRVIVREKARKEAERFVLEAYKSAPDKRIIVLEGLYPWKEVLLNYPEPAFVIYPQDGAWHVGGVPTAIGEFSTRVPFPNAWAGKRDKELADISSVADAVFCHNGRFLAVATSKEGAVKLAELAIKMTNS